MKKCCQQSADQARSDYLKSKELALLIEAHVDKARKETESVWNPKRWAIVEGRTKQARAEERAKVLKEVKEKIEKALNHRKWDLGAPEFWINEKDWKPLWKKLEQTAGKQAKK